MAKIKYWVAVKHDDFAGDILPCDGNNPDEAIELAQARFRRLGFPDPQIICCSISFEKCCERLLNND